MHLILFIIFAALCLTGAVNLLLQKHPINSALSLIVVMTSLAVLYLLLGAEFIAAAQMIVYAGAIMVLFVFVIMVLNAGGERLTKRSAYVRIFGVPLMAMFLGLIAFVIQAALPRGEMVTFGAFTRGGPADFGRAFFTQYLLPFEVVSVLILIALIGAIVLARKEID